MGALIEPIAEFNLVHWNWCIANRIKIYYKIGEGTYTKTIHLHGRSKKSQIPYVQICVINDGNAKRFETNYKQDDELLMSNTHKLYKYYYDRSNK